MRLRRYRISVHQLPGGPLWGDRCRYTDRVEIHAGFPTPGVRLFARLFYDHDQRRWRQPPRLLG